MLIPNDDKVVHNVVLIYLSVYFHYCEFHYCEKHISSKVWVFQPHFVYYFVMSWHDMSHAKSN